MPTINIKNNLKSPGFLAAPCQRLFVLACLWLGILCLGVYATNLEEARHSARQSEAYYQKAVKAYQDLIAQGKDLDRLYLEIGRLYFLHGDYSLAADVLKKTALAPGKKILALTYYRLNAFTEALEIFQKMEFYDDESRYFYGLTCEKLNLFDRALEIYKKIQEEEFRQRAVGRIEEITKQSRLASIWEISPLAARILSLAPPAEEYPQAGAFILYCDEKIKINSDHTQLTTAHYIVKILNERGKEDFSETHIDYDSTYEKVELEYARTIKPSGEVVEVGSRNLRDVSKYLNFPLYSNARVFIISFPEISSGAAIEYKVRIYRSQLMQKEDFVLSYFLQTNEPVMNAYFSLDLPKEKSVYLKDINARYNTFGAVLKPRVKEIDNRLIYTWHFKDIPQIIPEANMPAEVEINPGIIISSFKNWQEIYEWWLPLAKDKIKADAAIKEKVKGLIRFCKTREEKARAIYNFCAREIRYVAVEYGDAGYEPHSAADIFKNKYGDCKDQAILLVTMLREAGISAYPVLVPTRGCYNLDPAFPAALFNHCIALAALPQGFVFMDPTAETCSFGDLPSGDQGRRVFVIKEDGFLIQDIPFYKGGHNLLRQQIKIEVHPDETISAQKSIFPFGVYAQAQRYWLLYTPPELIQEQLKEKIQDISIGAVLKRYEIKNLQDLNAALELTYSFSGPEYFTLAGPALRIMPQLTGLDTALVAKERRKYPLDFALLESKETILEIGLPVNFVLKYLPENVKQENPWFNYEVEYRQQTGKIIMQQKLESKVEKIPSEEYPKFKEQFSTLAKKIKQRIVLEKK